MSDAAGETARVPQPYRAPVSRLWWLRRRSYLLFVMRELSSVFVAWSVAFLLLMVHAVGGGAADYRRFLDWAATPWVVVLDVITLAFLLLHSVTWFHATPVALVLRLGGRRVPPAAIAGGGYVAWAVLSVLVAWLALRG